MHILGISAFFHDSAAALIQDGVVVAAAQEERFSRIKHDHHFPKLATQWCLEQAGLSADQLDAVVFYEKPLLKFERLLESYLAFAPRGLSSFLNAIPIWLTQKLHIPSEIDKGLGNLYKGPIYFSTHHESHAASAFYPSPFQQAAILTLDGVGEWATTSWGVGRENRIEMREQIEFPHSLGLLYSAFTYYTGFRVNSGEYKLMGLAPYGRPVYRNLILEHIIQIFDDGSFWLDQSYFNYGHALTMTNARFHRLFGGPPRKPEAPVTQKEMDLAASIQAVTEEVVLGLARNIHKKSGEENLCLAGGVALNCVANGRLLREGPFKNLWIQPASGDAGGALGAALHGWFQLMGKERVVTEDQDGSYYGSSFAHEEIVAALDLTGATYEVIHEEDVLAGRIAQLLASGMVVGHFDGRMEFGPRALGHRSILGDPRNHDMQTKMNVAIKFRESFRPFAPAVLEGRQHELFELKEESPYMLLVAPVAQALRIHAADAELFGIDKLKVVRSKLPAVTHVDFSARIQTVNRNRSPRFHRILSAFDRVTGCPCLVNTSFNIRGEPIVNTPAEAYRCFMLTDMDALVVGNALMVKSDQKPMPGAQEYKQSFKLD